MAVSHTELQLRVTYDAPATHCRRVLRVLPMTRPGQKVRLEEWKCEPAPDGCEEKVDAYGNRRLLLRHGLIERELWFKLRCTTEALGEPLPMLWNTPYANPSSFLLPTQLVDISNELRREAKSLAWQKSGPEVVQEFGQRVHRRLIYHGIPNPRPRPVSEVLKLGWGTCQDFSHYFIALCRAAGIASRYVAGYNPAEGQMHAWAEALVGDRWHAYDPTHGRAPSKGCVVVAIGRDFRDTRPVLGDYRGAGAKLELHCRTRVDIGVD